MQSSAVLSQSNIRHDEPVRALLSAKTGAVWSISPDASVYDAIELTSLRQVGALLVLSDGRLKGIVSERDYARKVILRGRSSHQTAVHEIMTAEVVFVTPDKTIDQCMRLMAERQIRHLPVVEQGRVVGMVSVLDIVSWIIRSHEQTIHQLENYITGSYPA